MNKNETEQQQWSQEDDLLLMERVANREEDAFEALSARFRSLVFSTVFRVINNHDDAEDLTQDVLLSIWKKAGSWDAKRGKLVTWIASISRNRAIDLIRSKTRRAALRDQLEKEERIDSMRFEESSHERLLQSEAFQITRKAIVELTPEQSEAIHLAYFEGLTQVEVAERVGVPVATAKARIRRGVQRLREMVPERIAS